jgi:hypothetical protein
VFLKDLIKKKLINNHLSLPDVMDFLSERAINTLWPGKGRAQDKGLSKY